MDDPMNLSHFVFIALGFVLGALLTVAVIGGCNG